MIEYLHHLGQNVQVGVCDETGHFNDLVFVNVQTRHLKNTDTDIKTSCIWPFLEFKDHFRPVSTGKDAHSFVNVAHISDKCWLRASLITNFLLIKYT